MYYVIMYYNYNYYPPTMYSVLHMIFPKKGRQHKEVKLFAFFEDSTDEDGTVLRFGLCSFDRFAFVE